MRTERDYPHIDDALVATSHIVIASGEGDGPAFDEHVYDGKRTRRALLAHLTKLRCGGDRWAGAWVYGYAALKDRTLADRIA